MTEHQAIKVAKVAQDQEQGAKSMFGRHDIHNPSLMIDGDTHSHSPCLHSVFVTITLTRQCTSG